MKKIHFLFVSIFYSMSLFAQTPQFFRYQCVVRDGAGVAVVNQSVNFQISIISGSTGGTVEYTETHGTATNPFGIATLEIGNGTPVTGSFAAISWGTAPHFVKVEADPTGGTTYIDMGTTQLLSVPYALYSEQAGNVQTYSAGNGISISGNVITNEAPDQAVTISSGNGILVTGSYPAFSVENTQPDQAVTLTPGGATAITGTYPNFTISSTDNNTTYTAGSGINVTGTTITNTAPDQTVSLTQGGATTISGTYPNFTISSTDLNTGTPGGLNKTVQFNNNGSFGGDTALIWDNLNKRFGVGLTNPSGRVVIQGSSSAPATEPLFEVKNRFGQQIMVVYEDSVHFYISDDAMFSNKGGFAVSGRNNSKSLTNDFLRVSPDSTRIWTGDTLKGFGVKNIGVSSKTSYMKLIPSNYFIGHESGNNITTGLYNSFLGFQAGKSTNTGSNNVFIGYKSGLNNLNGAFNSAVGHLSMFSNTSGRYNAAHGAEALYSNVSGWCNVAAGYKALYTNNNGDYNTACGYQALLLNTSGFQNSAVGYQALGSNSSGANNTAVGFQSLASNLTGNYNTALGYNAYLIGTFTNSTALGSQALTISGNNMVRVGNASVTSIGGQVNWTTVSDERIKYNIEEDIHGLDFIIELRPVTYNYNLSRENEILGINDSVTWDGKNDIENIKFSGFIAQEVDRAAKKTGYNFSGIDKSGFLWGIRYAELTVPLVKAVQEQNVIIEEQKVQIQELKATNDELLQKYNSLKSEIDLVKTMINNQEIK